MKRLTVHPEAKAEVAAAISFYAQQRKGLGQEFRVAVDKALQAIRTRPRTYPKYLHEIRKKTLSKYPYSIYFADLEDRVLIMAVAHQRRQPD